MMPIKKYKKIDTVVLYFFIEKKSWNKLLIRARTWNYIFNIICKNDKLVKASIQNPVVYPAKSFLISVHRSFTYWWKETSISALSLLISRKVSFEFAAHKSNALLNSRLTLPVAKPLGFSVIKLKQFQTNTL